MAEATKEQLLELLEERREQAMAEGQIDNSSLYAGENMHYYCLSCGVKVAELPEDWWEELPPENCEDCKVLIENGWYDDQKPEFPQIRAADSEAPSLSD